MSTAITPQIGGSPGRGPDTEPLDHRTPPSSNRPPGLPRLNPNVLPLLVTVGIFVLMYAVGAVSFYDKNFFSLRVGTNLIHQNSVLAVAAIGATFVILSGGIDLSVGAVVAATTILIARMIGDGWNPLVAWAFALFCGTALGTVMGGLIHAFRLPAFMVTLAGMFFARAMAFYIYPQNLGIDSKMYVAIQSSPLVVKFRLLVPFLPGYEKNSFVLSLTLIACTTILCYVLATVVAQFTSFGRYVYALGGDEHSSELLGVPIARTRISTYAIAGFCSALAGILATLYSSSGDPASKVGMELEAIAAVVIGGSLISGGVGFMAGTLVGTLIAGLIQVLIDFQGGISSWWTKIVIGLLVLSFIVLQRLLLRLASPNTPGT